jgi:hypothetical protein
MPESRPLKVFLCHASADKPKVHELYRYLKKRGIQPWLDTEDLIPGQTWQTEIPKALNSSDAILICLTKNSVDKEGYVQKEIRFALDKALEMPEGRIFLIPVKLEDCEVPHRLSEYQWVNLFEADGFAKLIKALKLRSEQLRRAGVEESLPQNPLTIEPSAPAKTGEPFPVRKGISESGAGQKGEIASSQTVNREAEKPKPRRRWGWAAIEVIALVVFSVVLSLFSEAGLRVSWPAYIIIFGLALFLLGFFLSASWLAILSTIVTGFGTIFLYQDLTGNWASWSYLWPFIPGFVGLGIVFSGLLSKKRSSVRIGWIVLIVGMVLSFVTLLVIRFALYGI